MRFGIARWHREFDYFYLVLYIETTLTGNITKNFKILYFLSNSFIGNPENPIICFGYPTKIISNGRKKPALDGRLLFKEKLFIIGRSTLIVPTLLDKRQNYQGLTAARGGPFEHFQLVKG